MHRIFTKHFRRKIGGKMDMSIIHLLTLLIFSVEMVYSKGYFELEILEISNTNSHLLTGYCCGLPSSIKNTKTTGCPPCSTAFRLCLKEYQTNESGASVSTGCSFGNQTTPVLGGSSFVLNYPSMNGSIVLPFTFRWTKSFTLILQAFDMYNLSYPDPERLIEETSFSGVILPSPEWKTLDHIGKNARITYRVRVQCAETYYNTTCTTFCRHRNDQFGHFTCGPDGEKVCLDGWKGDNCDIAICKPGCDARHGKCDQPGECECRPGWRGPLCDECMVYPGCKHGSCNGSAWMCVCDTNWGGILCDQDLNYCGTHEPCMHGGTCENTAPDKYRCTCAEGLSGERCEIVEHSCATQPCKNGGTCSLKHLQKDDPSRGPPNSYREMRGMSPIIGKPRNNRNISNGYNTNMQQQFQLIQKGSLTSTLQSHHLLEKTPPLAGYTCACAPGWTGPSCEINIDECAGSPCRHGGTCIDLIGGFRCECPTEWTGDLCDIDVDECKATYSYIETSRLSEELQNLNKINQTAALSLLGAKNYGPCVNAKQCINLPGSFECICHEGWGGATCAENLDDCLNQCKNGATCIDLVNGYHCACATGYTGRDCETDINECINSPCRNGGECVDLIGKFNCICPLGFSGSLCEEAKDHCTPSPCLQGRCLNTPGSYYCHCPPNRSGKHCENARPLCSNPPCNDECFPNNSAIITPCSGHGSCESGNAGRFCKCHLGYIGKYCEQNLNECLPNPCKNGGICIDGDGDFSCECPAEWTGKLCSERSTECYKGQCQNGGTCVSGAPEGGIKSYCKCAPGWIGLFCTESIDQCSGQPCHNGGTCESGPNWFRCLCARGFSGPDCRININECSPQPCQGGATCIDGIGGYSCICPPERFGLRCEIMVSDPNTACANGSNVTPYFSLNHTEDNMIMSLPTFSEEYCNSCVCENGTRRCTNLWCGLPNCFRVDNSTKTSNLSGVCKQHEVCVPTLSEACLSPPCAIRGDCRTLEPLKRVAPPKLPAKSDCWPNQAILNENCARLNIIMDLQRVGEGSSVEGMCSALRVLLATRMIKYPKGENEGMLIIICDLKVGTNDTIEVTLSSTKHKDGQLAIAISLLSELLSKRHTNNLQNGNESQGMKFAPLISVLEVKVETARVENGSSHSLVIGMLCGILIVLIGFAIFFSLFWRQRLSLRSSSGINLTPSADNSRHDEEKSNNLQNEENLRRYTNPLKASTPSLNRTNIMELSISTSPVATVSPLGATSTSALHRSQPLFSATDNNLEQDLEFCGSKSKVLSEVQKRSSQLLLKTQNADVKYNISGSIDSPSKNFSKRSIKCKSMLSTDPAGDDVLTVVV